MPFEYTGGFSPTESQREAMEYMDGSLVVAAGAGSGKTRVLVERFINLLRLGKADVWQIVAITFTKKAAEEMKVRVRATLRQMAESDPGRRQRWLEMAEAVGHAHISTIHSFCAHLLRQFPVEAGIDPEFTTIEEDYERLLLEEAAEEVLNGYLEEHPDSLLWQHFSFGELQESLCRLYSQLRSNGYDPTALETEVSAPEEIKSTLAEALQSLREWAAGLAEAAAGAELTANTRARIDSFFQMWTKASGALSNLETGAVTGLDLLKEAADTLKGRLSNAVSEPARGFREAVEQICLLSMDLAAQPLKVELASLVAFVHQTYTRRKTENGLMDYEDLQVFARNLLQVDRVQRWCREQFRYIMVDEYQDTNNLQAALVSLLTGENPSDRVFVVGDPKQSIYRFRGADVEVFARTTRQILAAPGGKRVFLDTNFRSQEPLQEFINAFFAQLMPAGGLDYEVAYEPCRAVRKDALSPAVEWLRIPKGEEDDREAVREREAEAVAATVVEMVEGGFILPGLGRQLRYGDICVLLRAMSNADIYLKALGRYSIPYMVVSGKGFYSRQEIIDVLNFLRVLDNKYNEVALLGVLRSPFCGVNDETLYWLKKEGPLWEVLCRGDFSRMGDGEKERLDSFRQDLLRLRELRGRLPLPELLEAVVSSTGYIDACSALPDGASRVSNLEKLLSLAEGLRELSLFTMPDFIDFVREAGLSEQEGEAVPHELEGEDAVLVMTVHKAKGLEFPVVIIPDLSRKARVDAFRVCFDRKYGLGLKPKISVGSERSLSPTFTWQQVQEEEKRKALAEERRMFYVAATRAREYLVLVGADDRPRERKKLSELTSWSQWVAEILDPERCLGESAEGTVRLDGACVAVRTPHHAPHKSLSPGAETAGPLRQETALTFRRPEAQEVPRSFSVTELTVLKRCPRRYYYQYRLNIPEPSYRLAIRPGGPPDPGRILSPLQTGSIIHRVCERLMDKGEAEALLNWALTVEGVPKSLQPRAQEYLIPLLRTYTESRFFASLKGRGEAKSEVPFVLNFGDHRLVGTIDRLYWNGGAAEIVDFKTNDLTVEEIPDASEEYDIQMQLYSLAVSTLSGLPVTKATLYFLRTDTACEVSLKPEETKEWLASALPKTVGDGPEEIAQNVKACKHCYYSAFCWAAPELREEIGGGRHI